MLKLQFLASDIKKDASKFVTIGAASVKKYLVAEDRCVLNGNVTEEVKRIILLLFVKDPMDTLLDAFNKGLVSLELPTPSIRAVVLVLLGVRVELADVFVVQGAWVTTKLLWRRK